MSSTAQDSPRPSEASIASSLGWQAVYFLARGSTFTLIYGIFVLLFLHTSTVYFTRKQSSRSQHWMFLITTITFVLATINEVGNLVGTGAYIRSAFVENQDLSARGKAQKAVNAIEKSDIMCSWLNAFEAFISDCVIVWRAFVLLQHRRWLVILPLFLALCSLALSFPYMLDIITHSVLSNNWKSTLVVIGNGLSLGANIVATILIGHVYWVHRRHMSLGLGIHHTTHAERLLALLIESGVLFCLLQGTMLVLEVSYPNSPQPGSPAFYAYAIFGAGYYGVAAMYPTVVIALVNNRCTFLDHISSVNTFSAKSRNGP